MNSFQTCGTKNNIHATELLTVRELAEKLKAHRSYIYSKIHNGCFEEKVHYIKIGKKKGIRFFWSAEAAKEIFTAMNTPADRKNGPKAHHPAKAAPPPGTPRIKTGRKRGPKTHHSNHAPPPGTPRINLD